MTEHEAHPKRRLASSGALVLIAILLFFGLPTVLHAQIDTGGLTGTVTDSTGAKIVGAQVTLTNTDTTVAIKTYTTSTGTYVFGSVKAGSYSLNATSKGFKAYRANGIQVHVQQTNSLDIQLQVGDATEQVTVSTSAALIQTEDATVGQTIDGQTMNDMPLNGRDWASLGQISAGVTTTAGGAAGGGNFVVNGVNYWQNDYRLDGIDNNVEMYGGQTGSNATVTPPPDAVQEFKLQTGDFNAEFGHSTGGVINAVIKSGGNQVHGDLWEYVRNTILDANDYFNKNQTTIAPRSPYHQNQFGGTVGGPVYLGKIYDGRNKSFFFFDYQGTRIISPEPSTVSVPTALEQSSGFTNLTDLLTYSNSASTPAQKDSLGRSFLQGTVFDPATTRMVPAGAVDQVSGLLNTSGSAIAVRDPFFTGSSMNGITNFTTLASELNQISSNRLDSNAVKLMGVYPKPTAAGITNNYHQNGAQTNTINQFDIRGDQNFGTKDIVFGVFNFWHYDIKNPGSLPGIADGGGWATGDNPSPHYAVAAGYTHLVSPDVVNEFHFGFGHDIDNILPNESSTMGIPAQYGIQGLPQVPLNGGLPTISIGGLQGLGIAGWMPTIRTIYYTELADSVTKVYGGHALKAGAQVDKINGNITQPTYGRGDFNFSGQYSDIPYSGNGVAAIADILVTPGAPTAAGGIPNLGGVSSYSGSAFSNVKDERYYMGLYLQDDWKVTPKLTLNLGVRWDFNTPYKEVDGKQANFIPSGSGNGVGGTYYIPNKTCNTTRSASFNALLAKDAITVDCIPSLYTGMSQFTNYAPRIGFAYHFLPKVVVRGGYGIAYGALGNIGFGGTLGQNYPFSFTINSPSSNSTQPVILPNGATATMENTFGAIDLTNPASVTPANGIGLFGRQWNYQTPYTQTMNLAFQFQLDRNDAISVGYVGALGRHLDNTSSTNQPSQIVAPGANEIAYVPDPDFQIGAGFNNTNGTSSYNGMQLNFNRQMSHGLSVVSNYTFSKCFTDQSTQGSGAGYRAPWLPGFGIKGDYGLCSSDAKSVFHLAGTYKLPIGRGGDLLANANRVTDLMLGGWSANFIFTEQSGQPFTIGCPVSTTAFFGCNANVVAGQNIYAGPHNSKQWLNPAAFATPPVATATSATFASLGGKPMQARGPAYTNLDASLFKNFNITEKTKLQFRAEAFNFTNSIQFGNPGNLNYTNASNFSAITSERGTPREVQLALKLSY
jgi:hypothetical protein